MRNRLVSTNVAEEFGFTREEALRDQRQQPGRPGLPQVPVRTDDPQPEAHRPAHREGPPEVRGAGRAGVREPAARRHRLGRSEAPLPGNHRAAASGDGSGVHRRLRASQASGSTPSCVHISSAVALPRPGGTVPAGRCACSVVRLPLRRPGRAGPSWRRRFRAGGEGRRVLGPLAELLVAEVAFGLVQAHRQRVGAATGPGAAPARRRPSDPRAAARGAGPPRPLGAGAAAAPAAVGGAIGAGVTPAG